mgnify:CR=1 FL=1
MKTKQYKGWTIYKTKSGSNNGLRSVKAKHPIQLTRLEVVIGESEMIATSILKRDIDAENERRFRLNESDTITRMEAMQSRFGRLQLEDRKRVGEYFDREMANRSDNGSLDYLSDEQGEKELGEGWRQ